MDVQAGLSLCCSQTLEDRLSHVKAHMILEMSFEELKEDTVNVLKFQTLVACKKKAVTNRTD